MAGWGWLGLAGAGWGWLRWAGTSWGWLKLAGWMAGWMAGWPAGGWLAGCLAGRWPAGWLDFLRKSTDPWAPENVSITKGNTTKAKFVRNTEINDAEKCEYYVGKNKNLKSRQTQTKLGTPKRLMIIEGFRQNGRRAP